MAGEISPMPRWKAVVAMAANRVIGRDGGLPWHLPDDLKFFKRLTSGHAIAMGRTTYESIGRPLPKRRNIVVSTTMSAVPEGCELVRGLAELADLEFESDLFIIGGAKLYEAALPSCSELLLSFVYEEHGGDTFFPAFEDQFELVEVLDKYDAFEVRRYRNLALQP